MRVKYLVSSIAFALTLTACGANKLTPDDATDLSTFGAEIGLCNAQPDPLTCKEQVKVLFDAKEKAKFADAGGYVAPDAGGAL